MKTTVFFVALVVLVISCTKNNSPIKTLDTSNSNGRYNKEIFSSVKKDSNLLYGSASNLAGAQETLYMDIYEPDSDIVKKRVLIIYVHGGGWGASGKDEGKEFCTLFAKKGYVAASIDYRLGIEYPINEKTRGEAVYRGVQDIRAAIRYVRSNASQFGIDPDQIFLGGYSAGAVNAVWAAYLDENEVPEYVDTQKWGRLDTSGINLTSSKVQGVYGIAGAIGDTNWIQAGDAPIICVHGKTEIFLPYISGYDYLGIYDYGAVSIIQRATSLKIPATLLTYENIAHDEYLNPVGFDNTTNAIKDFLYTKIKLQQ